MRATLNAGVLFCGGCNPRFDRMLLLQKLRQHFHPPGADEDSHFDVLPLGQYSVLFHYYEDDQPYHFIVLINGCDSECLLDQAYTCPVVLLKTSDFHAAAESICCCIHSLSVLP